MPPFVAFKAKRPQAVLADRGYLPQLRLLHQEFQPCRELGSEDQPAPFGAEDHDVVIDGGGAKHFIEGEVLGEEAAGEGREAQGTMVRHHDGYVVPRMNLVHHLPWAQPLYRPASDRALKTKEPLVGLN